MLVLVPWSVQQLLHIDRCLSSARARHNLVLRRCHRGQEGTPDLLVVILEAFGSQDESPALATGLTSLHVRKLSELITSNDLHWLHLQWRAWYAALSDARALVFTQAAG